MARIAGRKQVEPQSIQTICSRPTYSFAAIHTSHNKCAQAWQHTE